MASSSPTGGRVLSHADSGDKSGLSALVGSAVGGLGIGISEKKLTRDGQPAKRRGPKPDSRPALTRRQELNRQAQRTHRERKELYIKALEDEVLRLKEIYSNISQDKERLAEENRQLRQMLSAQGGSPSGGSTGTGFGGGGGGGGGAGGSSFNGSGYGSHHSHMGGGAGGGGSSYLDDTASNPSVGGYSGSASGSYVRAPSSNTSAGAFTPPPMSMSGQQLQQQPQQPQQQQQLVSAASGTIPAALTSPHGFSQPSPYGQPTPVSGKNPSIDYEQAGIDFVLTLEKPCMAHIPLLQERGEEENEPCGHALMASCPPEPIANIPADVPFGFSNVPGGGEQLGDHSHSGDTKMCQRTWELSRGDLVTLLQLSSRLNLDGEITPVMAWGMVLAHPRLGELLPADFQKLTEEMSGKIRCYGFGAVLEEFEARDAIENVFSTKPDLFPPSASVGYALAF